MSYHMVKRSLWVATATFFLVACSNVPLTSVDGIDAQKDSVFAPTLPTANASSETLVRQSLARIDAIDRNGPTLQSVISINPNAIAIAKALDAERADEKIRGPLHGIPVLLKDNIETKDDLPTTAGSWALIDNKNGRDAPLAAKLRQNGAVILGKTNLSQWANFRSEDSVSGWSSVRGQVRNPHSLNRSPCGSSSGIGENAGVQANFAAALEDLKAKGFRLIEIDAWEPAEGFGKASYDVLKYEFKATLNEYLASTTDAVKTRTLSELIAFNNGDARETAVFDSSIFEASEALGDLTSEEYTQGLELVLKTTRENGIDKMMADNNVQFLMAPSTAPTFLVDHMYGDTYPGGTGAGWVAAIAGYPHITVPMGTYKGLPTGVSFMSTAGADKNVVAMGYAYEQASGGKRVVPTFRPSLEQAENGNMLGAQ